MGRRRKSLLSKLIGTQTRRRRSSVWQMNAGTNHGGRKKHKGILGF